MYLIQSICSGYKLSLKICKAYYNYRISSHLVKMEAVDIQRPGSGSGVTTVNAGTTACVLKYLTERLMTLSMHAHYVKLK